MFQEEVIFDGYLNQTNRLRAAKKALAKAEEEGASEKQIESIKKQIEIIESNIALFTNMSREEYDKLYQQYREDSNKRVRLQEIEAIQFQEAGEETAAKTTLTEDAQKFWEQHHTYDVYGRPSREQGQDDSKPAILTTSSFKLVDESGKTIETSLELLPPIDNGTGTDQPLVLQSPTGQQYGVKFVNGKPVITRLDTGKPIGASLVEEIADLERQISELDEQIDDASGVPSIPQEVIDIQNQIRDLRDPDGSVPDSKSAEFKRLQRLKNFVEFGSVAYRFRAALDSLKKGLSPKELRYLEAYSFISKSFEELITKVNESGKLTTELKPNDFTEWSDKQGLILNEQLKIAQQEIDTNRDVGSEAALKDAGFEDKVSYSADDLNDYVEKHGSKQTKFIWSLIKGVVQKLGVTTQIRFRPDYEGVDNRGFYFSTTNNIQLRAELFKDPETAALVIVHELVHGATNRILEAIRNNDSEVLSLLTKKQINAAKKLSKLVKELQADPDTKNWYGSTNEDELLAELANSGFVDAIKAKKVKPSILKRFINFLADLFGFPRADDTVYSEALQALEDLIANPLDFEELGLTTYGTTVASQMSLSFGEPGETRSLVPGKQELIKKRQELQARLTELKNSAGNQTADLSNANLILDQTSEKRALQNRQNIANTVAEQMATAFREYLVSVDPGDTVEDLEDKVNKFISEFRSISKDLEDGVGANELKQFLENILSKNDDYKQLSIKAFSLRERASQLLDIVLQTTEASPEEKIDFKQRMQAAETFSFAAVENFVNKYPFSGQEELNDLEKVSNEYSDVVDKLYEFSIDERMNSAFSTLMSAVAENAQRNDFGVINVESLQRIVKGVVTKEELDQFFSGLGVEPLNDPSNQEIIDEGQRKRREFSESAKPFIGDDPASGDSLIRPGLSEEENEGDLNQYERRSGSLLDEEQGHFDYLVNVRAFHALMRTDYSITNNVHFISPKGFENGSIAERFGDDFARVLKSQLLFFYGSFRKVSRSGQKEGKPIPLFATLDYIENTFGKDSKEYNAAMNDYKIVMAGDNVIVENKENPKEKGAFLFKDPRRFDGSKHKVIYASAASINDLTGYPGKPSFLYKQIGDKPVETRYRDFDESRVDEYVKAYANIRKNADRRPLRMTSSSRTPGTLREANRNDSNRISYETLFEDLNTGTTVSNFIQGINEMLPPEHQGKSFSELREAGIITLTNKSGKDPRGVAKGKLKPGFHYLTIQGVTTVLMTKKLSPEDINKIVDIITWIGKNQKTADPATVDNLIDFIRSTFHVSSMDAVLTTASLNLERNDFSIARPFRGSDYQVVWSNKYDPTSPNSWILSPEVVEDKEFLSSLRTFLAGKNYSSLYADNSRTVVFYDDVEIKGDKVTFGKALNRTEYVNKMGDRLVTIFKKPTGTKYSDRLITYEASAQFTPEVSEEFRVRQTDDPSVENTSDPSDVASQEEAFLPTNVESNKLTEEDLDRIVGSFTPDQLLDILDDILEDDVSSVKLPEVSFDFYDSIKKTSGYIDQSYLKHLHEAYLLIDDPTTENVKDSLKLILKSRFAKGTPTDLNLKPYSYQGGVRTRILPKAPLPVHVDEAMAWFKERHPDAEVTITEDGETLGALLQGGNVVFSKTEPDALYHEAWHRTSMYFLSPEQRAAVYQEVRERLGETVVPVSSPSGVVFVKGTEMTDNQAEEYLADEFRKYRIFGEFYKFPPKAKKQKSLFERIVDFFVNMINWLTGQPGSTMEDLFFYADNGVFKNAKVKTHIGEFFMIPGMSSSETLLTISEFNRMFMKYSWSRANLENEERSIIAAAQSTGKLPLSDFWDAYEAKQIPSEDEVTIRARIQASLQRLKKAPEGSDLEFEQAKVNNNELNWLISKIREEHANYLTGIGYKVITEKNSVDDVEESDGLQGLQTDLEDASDLNPDQLTEEFTKDKEVAKNSNNWNRSKNAIKTTPPLVKAFFEGLVTIDEVRSMAQFSLEGNASEMMKAVVQKVHGLPMSEVGVVLQKMSLQSKVYAEINRRWRDLTAAAQNSKSANVALNLIYTSLKLTKQEFVTVSPTSLVNQVAEAQRRDHFNTFNSMFLSSDLISVDEGLYVLVNTPETFQSKKVGFDRVVDYLDTASPSQVLDFTERLFGPVLRESLDDSIDFGEVAPIISQITGMLFKLFEDAPRKYKLESGRMSFAQLRGTREYISLISTLAHYKYAYRNLTGDMSVARLKQSGEETRQHAIGENTHLTNILNDIEGIQNYVNLESAYERFVEIMVDHGFSNPNARDSNGRPVISILPEFANHFLINEIVFVVNQYIESGGRIPYMLTERIISGNKDESVNHSKAFEALSPSELITTHIKILTHGDFLMTGSGGRNRESTIVLRSGADKATLENDPNSSQFTRRFFSITDSPNRPYVTIEDHLKALFVDETVRVLEQRFLYEAGHQLPNSTRQNIESFGDNYNYVHYQDIYELITEADSGFNKSLDEAVKALIKDPASISDIQNISKGLVSKFEKIIDLSINQVLDTRAKSILSRLPKDSKQSPYNTVLEDLIFLEEGQVASAPDWVIITPFENVVIDEKGLVVEKAPTVDGKVATLDTSEIYSKDSKAFSLFQELANYRGLYVINSDLFGFSKKQATNDNALEAGSDRTTSFIDHVAEKYGWSPEDLSDIKETLFITEEEAVQVMREVVGMFKISTTEMAAFSMGSYSVFKSVADATRRFEVNGSNKKQINLENAIADRFDGRVRNSKYMRLNVVEDIIYDKSPSKVSGPEELIGKDKKGAFKNLNSPETKLALDRLQERVNNLPKDDKSKRAAQKLMDTIRSMQAGGFEGTDALSLISLDFYREFLIVAGLWGSTDLEKIYVSQMYHLVNEAIKVNQLVPENEKLKMPDGTVVDEGIFKTHPLFVKHGEPMVVDGIFIPQFNGRPVNINSNTGFKSLKPQGTGRQLTGDRITFYLLKTALTPIMPSEYSIPANATTPDAENVNMIKFFWKNTIEEQADIIVFESSNKRLLPLGINSVNMVNFGMQISESFDTNQESAISKQLLGVSGMDAFQNQLFTEQETELFKNLHDVFDNTVDALTINNAVAYFMKLGLGVDFANKNLKVVNAERFSTAMANMSDVGKIDKGSLEQIKRFVTSPEENQHIDTLIPGTQYRNVFTSAIEKHVITLRDRSAKQIVQEADISQSLKFWRIENGELKPPQIKLPVPKSLHAWIIDTFGNSDLANADQEAKNLNFYIAFSKFREAYRNNDPRIPKQIRQSLINRTPMDNRHSATPVEIADYLLPWEGHKITVPMELVFIYGFDFDYDKLTSYYQTPVYDRKNKSLTFVKELESEQDLKERILEEAKKGRFKLANQLLFNLQSINEIAAGQLKNAIKDFKRARSNSLSAESKRKQRALKKSEQDLGKSIYAIDQKIEKYTRALDQVTNKGGTEQAIQKYQKMINQLEERKLKAELDLVSVAYEFDDISQVNQLRSEISSAVDLYFNNQQNNPYRLDIFQEKTTLTNKLYDNLYKMMMVEPAAMLSMIPTGTSTVEELAEQYLIESESMPSDKWSDLFDIEKNAVKRSTILASDRSIGTFAYATPMFSRLQKSPVRFDSKYSLPFEGMDGTVTIGGMYDTEGDIASLMGSEFLNTALDSSKNPKPFFAGLDDFAASVIYSMLMLGTENLNGTMRGNISPSLIMAMLNQPAVKNFLKLYRSNVQNKTKYASKREARNAAFHQALALRGVSLHVHHNPAMGEAVLPLDPEQKDPVDVLGWSDAFSATSEEARLTLAEAEFNLRSQRMYDTSDETADVVPFLFQLVQTSLYPRDIVKGRTPWASRQRAVRKNQDTYLKAMQSITKVSSKMLRAPKDESISTTFNQRTDEVAILDAFVTMMVYSDKMTDFMLAFRKDSSLAKTVHQLTQHEETRRKLMDPKKGGLFQTQDVVNFYRSNYLKSFILVNELTNSFLKTRSLFYDPEIFDRDDHEYFFNMFGYQVTYDAVAEYFPSYLVQKFIPETDDLAKMLLFQKPQFQDSLLGLYREFTRQLKEEYKRAGGQKRYEDDVVIKNIKVAPNARDYVFKQTRDIQSLILTNRRIQGKDLELLQERIAQLTDPNATLNPDLVAAAKEFFDAASIASLYQNANNRFSQVGKALVNYPFYNDMLEKAVARFKEVSKGRRFNKAMFLREFAQSVIVANATDPDYVPAKVFYKTLPEYVQRAILPVKRSNDPYDLIQNKLTISFDNPNQEPGNLRYIRTGGNYFGDNYIAITVPFLTLRDSLKSFESNQKQTLGETQFLKPDPERAHITLIYKREKQSGDGNGYNWTYVGGQPVGTFYAVRPNNFMNRRSQAISEESRNSRKVDDILDKIEAGVKRKRVLPEGYDPNSGQFTDFAMFSNRSKLIAGLKASLTLTVGQKPAEKILKDLKESDIVRGLSKIFEIAKDDLLMAEFPQDPNHPFRKILMKIDDMPASTPTFDLWSPYRNAFVPHAGTAAAKAVEIFNATVSQTGKGTMIDPVTGKKEDIPVPVFERNEEKRLINQDELAVNKNALVGKSQEDKALFSEQESAAVVDAFYNFEKYFPGVSFPNERLRLAFLRMVDNGTIEIKCRI